MPPKIRPKLAPLNMSRLENARELQTAPVIDEAIQDLRTAIVENTAHGHHAVIRAYSLSQPQRGSEAAPTPNTRQKTLSGESNASGMTQFSRIFTRTFSKNYEVNSNASASLNMDEWRKLFDRYDMEHNGRVDGQIPVKDFEKVCHDLFSVRVLGCASLNTHFSIFIVSNFKIQIFFVDRKSQIYIHTILALKVYIPTTKTMNT